MSHNFGLIACLPDSTWGGGPGYWLLITSANWSVRLCICFKIASWKPSWLAPNLFSISSICVSTFGAGSANIALGAILRSGFSQSLILQISTCMMTGPSFYFTLFEWLQKPWFSDIVSVLVFKFGRSGGVWTAFISHFRLIRVAL